MLENNLQTIDLNLLKVLNELERQGSVTAAAAALGVGQPAVSQALSRLRDTLGDDLFVRGPGGMVPTTRTREIIGPLRISLGQIQQSLFGPQDFEATTTETRFFIGASDYVAALLVPDIMRVLRKNMPNANIAIRRADRSNAVVLLANGEIDLALGMFPETADFIRRRRLFIDRHVCVFNPALADLPDPISMQDYLSLDHMLVSLDGNPLGFVDDILKSRGVNRRVSVTTPYFLQSAYLLQTLPVMATLPERFVRTCVRLTDMAVRTPPFDGPDFTVSMAYRAGDDRNPRIAALTDTVLKASRSVGSHVSRDQA